MFDENTFCNILLDLTDNHLIENINDSTNPTNQTNQTNSNKLNYNLFNTIPQMESSSGSTCVEHSIYLTFSNIEITNINFLFTNENTEFEENTLNNINKINKVTNVINNYVSDKQMTRLKFEIVCLCNNDKTIYVLEIVCKVLCDDIKKIINTLHQLTELYSKTGLVIMRERISTNIQKTLGVPKTLSELQKSMSDRYILTKLKIKNISDEKLLILKDIYNKQYIENNTTIIFYKISNSSHFICHKLDKNSTSDFDISQFDINQKDFLKMDFIEKIKKEYVWYDTYQQLDNYIKSNQNLQLNQPIQSNKLIRQKNIFFTRLSTIGITIGLGMLAFFKSAQNITLN